MSERLTVWAERQKLARVLGVADDDLPPLDGVPSGVLRALRADVTDRLFDESASMLGPVSLAARLLPVPVMATIAQKAFGPLLCARTAAAIEPERAVAVASRLPVPFLVEVSIELDPRRAAGIVGAVPDEMVVAITGELGRRGEHVTMGRFLGILDDDRVLAEAMSALDDEAMLRTAFVLEETEHIERALALLPVDRLPGLLRVAAAHGLWAETLDLVSLVGPRRRAQLADVVAELDDDEVATLVDAAEAEDLWPVLEPLVALMSPAVCTQLVSASAFEDSRVPASVRAALRARV